MSKTYNLYNLEAPFKKYLLAGIKPPRLDTPVDDRTSEVKEMADVSVKNYLSDFRHFAGWLVNSDSHRLKADLHGLDLRKSASESVEIVPTQLESILTLTVINDYKNYLATNNLPHKTINRRLSTIRKFCSFCISQGWMKENPAKRVFNVLPSRASETSRGTHEDILKVFRQDLLKENLDSKTVNSYLSDVREFLGLV